jgi:hypothetical protein
MRYDGLGRAKMYSPRVFIDRLSFPTRVVAVIFVVVLTIVLLFDFENPLREISGLLPWGE